MLNIRFPFSNCKENMTSNATTWFKRVYKLIAAHTVVLPIVAFRSQYKSKPIAVADMR